MSELSKEDFFKGNIFAEQIEGATVFLDVLKEIKKEAKVSLKQSSKEIKLVEPKTLKDIESFNTKVAESKKQIEQLTKVERQELELQKEINKLKNDPVYKKQVKEVERLRQEKNAINKATREEIQAERAVKSEYTRQSKVLNELRKKYKDVALAKGENSKEARNLLKQIRPLDKTLKRVDNTVGQNQRSVGKYTNALKGLASQMGIFLGVAGAFRILKDSIGIVRDFEQQNATLAGVLGTSIDKIEELKNQQLELGATTVYTASEIGNLQEQYARLGFQESQILKLTGATLDLSQALQSDLGQTAELVGKTLNAFGLDTSNTQQVVDSMTRATQNSSLNFERLEESLSYVAPTAKALGLDLQQTTGILGVLVDNGIKASRAGRLLSSSFARLNEDGLSLDDAIQKISDSTDKTAKATELFGVESFTLGLILAENQDKVSDLTDKIRDNENAAKDLAETQKNTLNGSLKLLNSAWEGYILNLNDATNGGNLLTKGIRFLSENLNTILDWVGRLTTAFLTYKLTVLAVTKATQLYNTVSSLFINGIKGATSAFSKFNKVTRANILGVIASLVVTLVFVFKDLFGALSDSEKAQRRLNEAQKEAEQSIAKERAELTKLISIAKDDTRTRGERQRAIEELNRISPEYLGNLTLENIKTAEGANLLKNYVLQLEKKAKATALNNQLIKIEEELAKERNKTVTESVSLYDKTIASFKALTGSGGVSSLVEASTKSINENVKSLENQKKAILSEISSTVEVNDIIGQNIDKRTKVTKAIKEQNKAIKEGVEQIKKLQSKDSIDSLLQDEREKAFEERQKEIDRQIELADLNRQIELDKEEEALRLKREKLESFDKLSQSLADREKLRSDRRISQLDREIQAYQERANTIRQLAESGNANAKNSLAELQRAEAEATLRKERELQKQKRAEAGLALLKTYTAELSSGKGATEALATVIKNGALLSTLIASLPSFDTGTDNTSKDALGQNVDGKGGFLAINHPNEKIFNADDSHKIGFDVPNSVVADTFSMVRKGLLVPKGTATAVNTWQSNKDVLQKFDSLEKTLKQTISSIPDRSFEFDRVERIVTEIVTMKNHKTRTHKKINI